MEEEKLVVCLLVGEEAQEFCGEAMEGLLAKKKAERGSEIIMKRKW